MNRIATSLPYTEMPVADGNFDTSRVVIDRIIIHTMVGSAASAASRFNTYGQQVSAHYGVKLDGSLIHWLEETFTAYQAGSYSMNQRSIGIEHEDNGDYNGVRPDTLYAESAKLVADICKFYSIPCDRQHILKHSEVIATGCPDALDIDRIVREAAAILVPVNLQPQLDAMRADRDKNWNLYQADETKITLLTSQNQLLTAQVATDAVNAKTLQGTIDSLKTQLSSQTTPPQTPPTPVVDYKTGFKTIMTISNKVHWFYGGDFKSILAIAAKYI
jgi:hypothetical protein